MALWLNERPLRGRSFGESGSFDLKESKGELKH